MEPMSADTYSMAFRDFLRLSDDPTQIRRWMDLNLIDILKNTMDTKAALSTENDHPFRLLSVGCGKGDKDKQIIAKALQCSANLSYTALDPNPIQLQQFETGMDGDIKDQVDMDFLQMTVEDYEKHVCQIMDSMLPYHFISAIHSVYHFKDTRATVEFLFNECLRPGGSILFMVTSSETGHGLLVREFQGELKASGCGNSQLSHVLDDALGQLGASFQVQTYTGQVDVSSCVAGTEEGDRLLNFLCTSSNIRHKGAKYFDSLLRRLKELSIQVDGKYILKRKNNIYTVQKPR